MLPFLGEWHDGLAAICILLHVYFQSQMTRDCFGWSLLGMGFREGFPGLDLH